MDAIIEHLESVENPPKTPADQAADLFTQSSIRYSGLTQAQAAYLALECQKLNLDPFELKDALLEESGKTAELTDLANRMHAKHLDKEPTGAWKRVSKAIKDYFKGTDEPPVVTEERVRDVIDGTFNLAGERMKEDPEKLRAIIALYPKYKDNRRSHRHRMDSYSTAVDQILAGQDVKQAEDSGHAAKDRSILRRRT